MQPFNTETKEDLMQSYQPKALIEEYLEAEQICSDANTLVNAGVCNYDEALELVKKNRSDDFKILKDFRGRDYKMPKENPKGNSGKASEQEHYKGLVQPLQIMIMTMTQAEVLGFLKGNVIKYACRAGRKDGESYDKDMTKCKQYFDWVKELEATGKITL